MRHTSSEAKAIYTTHKVQEPKLIEPPTMIDRSNVVSFH
jgi:hypothetical protein